MNTAQQAYDALAQDILRFVDGRAWDCAGANYKIYFSMVSSDWWLQFGEVVSVVGGGDSSLAESKLTANAVRFLRADLLRTTGQRIWALTFTLYPDGKFNIEYDYNKPDDYEETDEMIDVSLTDFANRFNKT